MKLVKKFLLATLIVVSTIVVATVAIPELQSAYTVEAASIKISKTKKTMNVKETYQLKISGTKKKAKWSSSNKKVATVNSKGVVTAKKKGKVTITAKVGSQKYKCAVKVESPKINKTKATVYVGNTYTLKVSGTTQSVKWSTSNKKIATVSSKGIVTAKKAGTATITAKVGSTKYKCKVTVTSYDKNIKVSFVKSTNGVIALLTNNNSCSVNISPTMVFYDANRKMQSTVSKYCYYFEPKSTIAVEFDSYNSTTYKYQPYSSYKMSLNDVKPSLRTTNNTKKIKTSASLASGELVIEVKNNSGKDLKGIELAVIFYDENNKILDLKTVYPSDCYSAGSTGYTKAYYPYDENYKTVVPSSYKIYVNNAY